MSPSLTNTRSSSQLSSAPDESDEDATDLEHLPTTRRQRNTERKHQLVAAVRRLLASYINQILPQANVGPEDVTKTALNRLEIEAKASTPRVAALLKVISYWPIAWQQSVSVLLENGEYQVEYRDGLIPENTRPVFLLPPVEDSQYPAKSHQQKMSHTTPRNTAHQATVMTTPAYPDTGVANSDNESNYSINSLEELPSSTPDLAKLKVQRKQNFINQTRASLARFISKCFHFLVGMSEC